MTKKFAALFILSSLIMISIYSKEDNNMKLNVNTVKEITKACLDYVEGFYESSKNRIENGVHKKLVKRNSMLNELTRDELVKIAISSKRNKPNTGIVVTVFDISGNIAVAKIISEFVDYVELVKIDGKWQVINVLWDYKNN